MPKRSENHARLLDPMGDHPELTPVRARHRFDERRLAEYLSQQIDPSFADLKVLQFEGGQSNPTFSLTLKI
ncbi:MAG TPA: hypothetical protein QF901_08150 [Gammaproteobacteria bacterium]|jgi:hypothetical protein|nr:hypothetical protein [Candidatus Hydrogenedentota bacterium]HJP35948.1 hypothetical protein [Gammaproteobacteria bacterium]